jgi:endo-1,4-beta-xylanase
MTEISRRECVAAALAAAVGCVPLQSAVAKKEQLAGTGAVSLNRVAQTKGLRFGSCLGDGPSGVPVGALAGNAVDDGRGSQLEDPNMRTLMVAQCGILVPENELKWYALRKTPVGFDFKRADMLVDFAEKNGMAVRGHTLLWARPQYNPEWVLSYDFGSNPGAAAEAMLIDHVKTVCGRYGKRIFSYDVINELVVPETGALEQTPFTKYLGQDVVDIMFHAARAAAPHAQLVYNDYMNWTPKSETHRTAVLKLLERMRKNNVPVDALGIQSHVGIGFGNEPVDDPGYAKTREVEWRRFLDEVVGMGFDLVVTEFDVNDKNVQGDIAVRDEAVASLGGDYLSVMLSYPQTRYVMAWGIVDKYSWLQHTSPRPDGQPKRPCPYDDKYKPKLLRDAMVGAFHSASARPAMDIKPG